MDGRAFSGKAFAVVGASLFLLGSLLLVHEATVFGIFSQIFPDSGMIEAFGAAIQLIGGITVVFGVTKVASATFLSSMRRETQSLRSGFDQTIDRIDRLITVQRATLIAAEAQAAATQVNSIDSFKMQIL